jgi:hypothetical protein
MSFNPINKSKASSFLFKLHNDLTDVEFYVVETELTSVKLEMKEVKAPSITYPLPGTQLTYGTLPLTILCDEGLEIWTKLDRFVTESTSKPDIVYTNIFYPSFTAILYLLSNKGSTVIKKVEHYNCYVEEVTPYKLSRDDDKIETFDVKIVYSHRKIIDVD